MNTFDTDEKLNRFLPRGVEGEIGEWLSTGIGEDELWAVGIRPKVGRLILLGSDSTSTVSSSGITSSCLDEGLVALPGMKNYIFTIDG
jgi:hypothetical protein